MSICRAGLIVALVLTLCSTSYAQFGGAGAGGAAINNQERTQGLEQTGQLSSDAAIVRDATAPIGSSEGSFLGGAGGGTGRGGGGFGGFGGGGFGGFGGLGGLFGGSFQQNNTNTPKIRIPMRVAFANATIAPTAVKSQFTSRLARLPGFSSNASSVTITIEGRTATLNGVVESDSKRQLLRKLAMMEPGISTVENNLQIASE